MKDKYTELYERLSRLQWLLQRRHIMNHAEYGPFADTTRGQGRVMAALKMQSEISTKDLSYLLGITVPSLNELLNKLEKSGHLVRVPSEADKRVMVIQLTEKGKDAQPTDTDYSGIFNCLEEEEQEMFGDYLDRVINSLEAQVGNVPDEEAINHWMKGALSRMGDERFSNFMKQGLDMPGAVRFIPDFGGTIPGVERFAPDFDGIIPEGREWPLGRESGKKKDKSDEKTDKKDEGND